MGKLSYFPLSDYINKFRVRMLVETGCGTGFGIDYAMLFDFDSIYSCEIVASQADYLSEKYRPYDWVNIFKGKSIDFLNSQLLNLSGENSIIFWLDSHFPGADLGQCSFDYEKNLSIRLPLEQELELIHLHRNPSIYRDIILIDDWRIYEKMDFPGGDLDKIGLGHIAHYGTNFIDKWSASHILTKIPTDTGYLTLLPRK